MVLKKKGTMDFGYTEEQKILKRNAHNFWEKEIAPIVDERERGGVFSKEEVHHYLDMLDKREDEISKDRGVMLPSEIELPASLKFIEELYAQARSDSSHVEELRLAVQQLKTADRLLILRKYGDEIMRLLGYQL